MSRSPTDAGTVAEGILRPEVETGAALEAALEVAVVGLVHPAAVLPEAPRERAAAACDATGAPSQPCNAALMHCCVCEYVNPLSRAYSCCGAVARMLVDAAGHEQVKGGLAP